jgi:hypothetical protein
MPLSLTSRADDAMSTDVTPLISMLRDVQEPICMAQNGYKAQKHPIIPMFGFQNVLLWWDAP